MPFHLMVYIRVVLTTLVTITCLLGDNFVELTEHPVLRALVDNGTHAVIGAITGIAFVIQFYDKITNCFGWSLILLCFLTSSLIDLDHFIQARSWNLEDATNLLRRPFLHCTTIPMVIFSVFIWTSCLNYFKTSLWLGALFCAFFTHHTRDAIRRGYWMCPYGTTNALSYIYYVLLTIITPYLVYYTYSLCSSSAVQRLLGFSTKNESRYSSYKYSVV
ncbi:C5orf28 family protein [Megaselia abdita]